MNISTKPVIESADLGQLQSASPAPLAMRDQSLAANLRRLSLLTHDWPGQPLDEHGTIRLLNPDAAGPPLFWCFNGQQEFPALAAAFARQRPLVGMRSLNQIMPEGPGRYFPDQALAEYYAATALRQFGAVPCTVGGNCQAASVAHFLALRLLEAGARVERLVTVEAVIRRPYPGHMRLLFSGSSQRHNPFLTQVAPDVPWQHIYRAHDWQIMPAAHGQFFWPDHVGALAQAISKDTPQGAFHSASDDGPSLVWSWANPGPQPMGREAELTAPAGGSGLPAGMVLLAHWQSAELGSWVSTGEEYLSPIRLSPGRSQFTTQVRLPDQPGLWTLDPVLCRRDLGPLNWSSADRNIIQAQVV